MTTRGTMTRKSLVRARELGVRVSDKASVDWQTG